MLTITAPSSKSMSHRALIAAALTPGESTLSTVLRSNDTTGVTLPCLAAMGADITELPNGDFRVNGMAHGPQGGPQGGPQDPVVLEVHESGTSCRLLTAIAAAGRGRFLVRGAPRMHQRPIAGLTDALAAQGVGVEWLGLQGCPPLVLQTHGLAGGEVAISMEESSQYLSGLLLAAPTAAAPTTIAIGGSKAVSWPYVSLTLTVMRDFGVEPLVEAREHGDAPWMPVDWRTLREAVPGLVRFHVRPGRYQARSYAVEADWSSASYFLAAGAVALPLTIQGLRQDSMQGDKAMADILERMGAQLTWQAGSLAVSPPPAGQRLRGVDVDMAHCPDIVMSVAMAALFAVGPTFIRGVPHLRIKESDRLQAVADAMIAAGAEVEVLADGLRIVPGPLPAGRTLQLKTHGDHRMAMSFSLLELAGATVGLDNAGCVAKSFPGFFDQWVLVRTAAGVAS